MGMLRARASRDSANGARSEFRASDGQPSSEQRYGLFVLALQFLRMKGFPLDRKPWRLNGAVAKHLVSSSFQARQVK